jgi:hypothetical protein
MVQGDIVVIRAGKRGFVFLGLCYESCILHETVVECEVMRCG